MGLGKTLQLLALIAHTREAGERRPFLVVAPTSVLSTWRSEAARFTPDLRVAVVDATRAKRGIDGDGCRGIRRLVVTSYTLLRLDEAEFARVEWAALVLDEAQFVKNSQTKAYRAARDLRADVDFAITGTPMENSLTELWALLSLAAPGLFAVRAAVPRGVRRPDREGQGAREPGGRRVSRAAGSRACGAASVRSCCAARRSWSPPTCRPSRSRRCGSSWAPRTAPSTTRCCSASGRRCSGLLDDLDRNRFIVFRSLTLLRMLSLAPELVDPAHAHIAPSKLDALFEQLDEILAEGHRTLVFSQFTSFLGLVAARLEERGIRYAYLDGSTRDRDAAIASFREGDAPVFLISLKAGGFGLTLTEADYVFLLDPWWNPAAESQAVDRAHRIGQTRRSTSTGSSRRDHRGEGAWRCSSARRACSAP